MNIKFLDLSKVEGKDSNQAPANLVGATDQFEMQQAEQILGGVRAWEVRTHQAHIPGNFGAAHLADIHAYVLQDVYPIVGETRADALVLDKAQKQADPSFQVPTPATHREGAGGETITLLPADQVNTRLDQLAQNLTNAHYLRGLEKPEFVERFTQVYTEYARVHPFEHGTQPVLVAAMGLLAEQAGYQVDIGLAPTLQRETDALLANAAAGDPRRLQAVLAPFITEDESEVGILSRRITLQVIKPKPPPEFEAQGARLDLVQASIPFIQQLPSAQSEPLRNSLRAIYEGDDNPTHLQQIRQVIRAPEAADLRPAGAQVEAAATHLDNLRQQRQTSAPFEQTVQRVLETSQQPAPKEIAR